MITFNIHKLDTAEGKQKEVLSRAKQKYGFDPNMLGVMAESPVAANAFLDLADRAAETIFTPTERHVVWFAINFFHNDEYCMASHSVFAIGEKIDKDVIRCAREGNDYSDTRLQALKVFTEAMISERGQISEAQTHAFMDAGYTKQHMLEVIVLIAHKTMSNYVNHLARTAIDDVFQTQSWTNPKDNRSAA